VRYLHSEIETLERIEIITDLRAGEFDVLVGVNLLREGLDMPEVSLVCMLDADKEGFLRKRDQPDPDDGAGGAERERAKVIMYADSMTPAMRKRDRGDRAPAGEAGQAYNAEHGITPKTIQKAGSAAGSRAS
jgi:excinuclease ABC subunit B